MEGQRRLRPEELNGLLRSLNSVNSVASDEQRASIPASQKLDDPWKDRGNQHFKSGAFKEAISCYSKSIDSRPTCVAYANRAMAYLKLKNYTSADQDCSSALDLDPGYVKAWLRRGTARKELGLLEGAIEDFEQALRYEPGNKAAMEDRKACVDKWLNLNGLEAPEAVVLPVKTAVLQQELLTQVETKRMAGAEKGEKAALVEKGMDAENEQPPPLPGQIISEIESSHRPMEVEEHGRKKETINGNDDAVSSGVVPKFSPAAPQLKVPRSGVDFERAWRGFKANIDLQAAYLRIIDADKLPMLLKQALTPPLLVSLQLTVLGPVLQQDPQHAAALLEALVKVPRFSMNVMSLSAAQKMELKAAWDAANLEGLRAAFCV